MLRISILCCVLVFSSACVPKGLPNNWEIQGFVDWSCDSLCTASLPLSLVQNKGYYLVQLNVSTEQAFGKEIFVGLAGQTELIESCDLLPSESEPYVISVRIDPMFRGTLQTKLNVIVLADRETLNIHAINLISCPDTTSTGEALMVFGIGLALLVLGTGSVVLALWLTGTKCQWQKD